MSGVGAGLRAALLAQDHAAVVAALGSSEVLVPAMTAGPNGPVALFAGVDDQRALYAFSDEETFAAWAEQVGDDGHRVVVAGSGLGELALDQRVDAVILDPGTPGALVVAPEALALSLAGDAGTVLSAVDGVSTASGPAADAVAAALAAVLEWEPVRSAWLITRAAGAEDVLTVAMAGVDLDGAVRRCQEATAAIPASVPLDVIALDEAQEAWISTELPAARLTWKGAPPSAARAPAPRAPVPSLSLVDGTLGSDPLDPALDNPELRAALVARDQTAILAALLAGTAILTETVMPDGGHRVEVFADGDGQTSVCVFSTAATFADWVRRSGHEGGYRVIGGAGLGELLRTTGADALVLDTGAEHALAFQAASLAPHLV